MSDEQNQIHLIHLHRASLIHRPLMPNRIRGFAFSAETSPQRRKADSNQKSTLILMFFVLLVGIGLIMWAWQIGPFQTALQQTDNSYVKGKTTVLSSQINGYIKTVLVKDFDTVKKVSP